MDPQKIETPVGILVAQWTDSGLYACKFEREGRRAEVSQDGPGHEGSLQLKAAIDAYFETGQLHWDLNLNDWSNVPDFHRIVLKHCYEIPPGQTITYGQLATRSGHPQAARAVGGAMARNRWPIVIPCHRVVGANGKLTGYSGAGGLPTKRRLLDWELSRHGHQPLLFS